MTRRLRHVTVVAVAALSVCGMNVASSAACVDHFDHGIGNEGDPGDGQSHHNEDLGIGNGTDPGNGQGHFCTTE